MNPFEGFYRALLAQDPKALELAEELTRRVSSNAGTPRERFLLETLRRLHEAHARCGEVLLDDRFRNVMSAMRTAREKGSDEMFPLMMPSPMTGARGGGMAHGGGGFGGGMARGPGGFGGGGARFGMPGHGAPMMARPPHTPGLPGHPGMPPGGHPGMHPGMHHPGFRPGFRGGFGGWGWPWAGYGYGWPGYAAGPFCPPCPTANYGVCPTPY